MLRRVVSVVAIAGLVALGLPAGGTPVAADQPSVSIDPDRAAAGSTVIVEGVAFDGYCDVLLHWGSADGALLGIGQIADDGTFSTSIDLPVFAEEGESQIQARARDFGIEGCGGLSGTVADGSVTVTDAPEDMWDRRIMLLTRTLDDPGIDSAVIDRARAADAPIHAIVQLEDLPRPRDVATLEELGVTLHRYLNAVDGPGTAYLAALAPDLASDDARFGELVRGVQELLPEDKVDPVLRTRQRGPRPEIRVTTFPDVPPQAAEAAFDRQGVPAQHVGRGRYEAADVARERAVALAEEDVVQFVQVAPEEGLIDLDDVRDRHGVEDLQEFHEPSATYLGLSGLGTTVSIHDSGVDEEHRDFENRLIRESSPGSDHGTHVASIAAGSGLMSDKERDDGVPNNGDPWQWRGMAPQSEIAAFGFTNADSTSTMGEAIEDHGVDVSNHSYSYNDGQYDSDMASIDEIIRGDAGIPARPQVFSAGNQGASPQHGNNHGYFSLSKSCKNCIIVGNLRKGGELNSGSSHGPTPDGRVKPDISAVGSNVTAAVGAGITDDPFNNTDIGNNYESKFGTSMSAPAVTGMVALLLQRYADVHGIDLDEDAPLPSTSRALLVQAAEHLSGTASFANNPDTGALTVYGDGPDWATGYGRADALEAIGLIDAGMVVEDVVDEDDPTEEHLVSVVPGQDELRVTLAWDDLPGTPNSDHSVPMLVNDLDLLLIGPNGETHQPLVLPEAEQFDCDPDTDGIQTGVITDACPEYDDDDGTGGSGPDPGPWPVTEDDLAAEEGTDRRNNLEQVVIDDPAPGLWRAQVSVLNTDATVRLPLGGDQPYSIAGVTDARADLSITKTAEPDPATAGQDLLYTVEVANDGPDDAANVVVADELPDGVSYVTDTDHCEEGPAGTLTCPLGDLPAGESTSFDIRVAVDSGLVADADGATTLTNTATVFASTPDAGPEDNTATLATIVEDRADLALEKVCKPDDEVPAGHPITCTIFVDNHGPSDARDVEVTDEILADGEFTISGIDTTHGLCTAGAEGESVTCDLGTFEAGDRAEITIETTAQEGMDINNVATVTSATPDPDTANNEDADGVTVVAQAGLSVSKTAPPEVVAGESMSYEITVSNAGPSEADNVVVTDALPSGVTIDDVSGSHDASCVAREPGDTSEPTSCAFGTLPVGIAHARTMTIDVTVDPDQTGTLTNDARVSSDTEDPDTSTNQASVATDVITEADLRVATTDFPATVTAGETLRHELRVDNDGPSTARQVDLRHALPDEAAFDGADIIEGDGACALLEEPPHTVSCDLGDLDPGEFARVVVETTVDPATAEGAELEATATVSSITEDPDEADNVDTATTTVETAADLGISKTSDKDVYASSDWIEYTVTVTNEGPSDALDVVVVDTLPLDSHQIIYRFDDGGCDYDEGAHELTCELGPMPAGSTASFDIHVSTRGNPGTFTNEVEVFSTTHDPNLDNNTDTREVHVGGGGSGGGGPGGGGGNDDDDDDDGPGGGPGGGNGRGPQ